jgi:flagellar motor switch protein FliN
LPHADATAVAHGLDTKESDQLWILAAGHPIARGEITIQGDRLCITVTEAADVHEFNAAA